MITLQVDGINYQYPEEDDEDWGQAATLWAQSVTDILSGFRSPSSPAATEGKIRFGNSDAFAWRNNANTDNILLFINSSDDLIYDDGSTQINLTANAAGNVTGPGSSTDNAIARYDGVTGQLIQDSVVIISDLGAVSGITDIAMTGDLSGADNLAGVSLNLSGNIAAVVDITMSGTLSGATSIDADAISIGGSDLGDLFIAAEVTPTDNAIVRWDGTTGTDVQNSLITIADDGDVAGIVDLTTTGNVLHNTGTFEIDQGTSTSALIDANTGNASIKLRLNNSDSNMWEVQARNSAGDELFFFYGGADLLYIDTANTEPIRISAQNIAETTTPEGNTLYSNTIPKAWADCTSAGVVNDGVNIELSSHPSTGVYNYDFKQQMNSATYAVSGNATTATVVVGITSRSATGFTLHTRDASTGSLTNSGHMFVVFGEQTT